MVVYLSGLTRQKEISGLIIKDRIGWIKVIYNIITNFFNNTSVKIYITVR